MKKYIFAMCALKSVPNYVMSGAFVACVFYQR